jgi:hypothetical protein
VTEDSVIFAASGNGGREPLKNRTTSKNGLFPFCSSSSELHRKQIQLFPNLLKNGEIVDKNGKIVLPILPEN